ncbi:MAG TPA: nickel/cobalt efflux transporter [Planctomycetota bacterium]|jgi:nickel/cobalt exporter
MDQLSLLYLPTAVLLGALHALEPGHAKTLTAAYLIGVKGTRRDAIVLGIAVAATHSIVVIALAVTAVVLGREAFADNAMRWLQLGSGILVTLLGSWMLWRRWPRANCSCEQHHEHHDHGHTHDHGHSHDHGHGDHSHMDEDEHAKAHAASMPEYVARGERPTLWQVCAFGAAGGLIPCPASITVMLLALSTKAQALGILAVLGFSLGLAIALVSVGLLIVTGVSKLSGSGRLNWITQHAPVISAGMVVFSGLFALAFAH